MKILHLTKKYPGALGGDAIVVANLQKHQQIAQHTVVIVTSNCDEIPNQASIYKVGFKDTPSNLDHITPKRLASLLVLFFRMFAILRDERPDVIHTHSVDMAFFASFAARFYGIPIVHTFHIMTFYDAGQPMIRKKSELWLAKNVRPRIVTAPNDYDVEKLKSVGMTQAALLPNGVDLAFWQTAMHAKKNEEFVFVAVGRLEHQKGYEYLIKAASLLAASSVTFRVIIAGEGSQKAALQKLITTLHLETTVTLAGRKSPEDIRDLFTHADAAVFPSLYETTPLTMLEAWAAATPVIVTSVGIVRSTPAGFSAAYIVPPKDTRALMQAMHTCMQDDLARTVVAASGHEEAKQYAWPLVAQTAETLYRSAL